MKFRNVTRLLEPGKLESEDYSAVEGVPEALLVSVEATKRWRTMWRR
jgi:hypothetical protein